MSEVPLPRAIAIAFAFIIIVCAADALWYFAFAHASAAHQQLYEAASDRASAAAWERERLRNTAIGIPIVATAVSFLAVLLVRVRDTK